MNAHLNPYLQHVRRLFPDIDLRVVTLPTPPRGGPAVVPDAQLEVRRGRRTVRLRVEAKRTHLATAVGRALLGALGDRAREWVLFAPYVGRPLGALFAAHGLNYVDLRGNCHLHVAGFIAAHVEGQRGDGVARPKGLRAAGARALLAIVADPDLLAAPGRAMARAAGTTHPTALDAVRRLAEAGAVTLDRNQRRWMPGGLGIALDRWLEEYETVLRPTLVVGTFRTPDRTPPDLDRRIADLAAADAAIRFGGAAAAFRIAPHHRGEVTVLHVDGDPGRVLQPLRAVPDPAGPLLVLGMPGPAAARGLTPETVHPLLVYAETLHAADDRTMEAAQRFRERALGAYA